MVKIQAKPVGPNLITLGILEFMVRPATSMLSASQASQSIPHWRLVGE